MARAQIGKELGVPQLRLDFPEPVEDEPDLTQKQRGFIHHLLRDVGAPETPEIAAESDKLGTYQASSVIDQLLYFKAELRGQKPLDTSRLSGFDFDDEDDDYAVKPPKATWGEFKVYAFICVALAFALLVLFSKEGHMSPSRR